MLHSHYSIPPSTQTGPWGMWYCHILHLSFYEPSGNSLTAAMVAAPLGSTQPPPSIRSHPRNNSFPIPSIFSHLYSPLHPTPNWFCWMYLGKVSYFAHTPLRAWVHVGTTACILTLVCKYTSVHVIKPTCCISVFTLLHHSNINHNLCISNKTSSCTLNIPTHKQSLSPQEITLRTELGI